MVIMNEEAHRWGGPARYSILRCPHEVVTPSRAGATGLKIHRYTSGGGAAQGFLMLKQSEPEVRAKGSWRTGFSIHRGAQSWVERIGPEENLWERTL